MKIMPLHVEPLRLQHFVLSLLGAFSLLLPDQAHGQFLTLANPHWNITLTDAGYSDYLLDNTPGFEGREYLSGEWGAAVGYQFTGGAVVPPQWLERQFVFPDWTNNSTFTTVTPLAQIGLNADNLPIAQSVIANGSLEITLRHEMIDTVVGTPMGVVPASATNTGASFASGRYVLKQTATLKNISGNSLTNVQFFQFLHGLSSQRGIYDNRSYTGMLSNFQYDVTMSGVDAYAVGAGSSSAGLDDYMGFHAAVAPSAFEIGYYGIEGNGVDAHGIGKPSDGVHLSVEDNWQNPPYSTRKGTDSFTPPQRWVAGAQRWNLGSLAIGQSVSMDVLLSLRTGTRVATGTGSSGGCNGGASVPGGVDYEFEDVSASGPCFAEFSKADADEIAARIDQGEFSALTFLTPGGPTQLWKLQFTGVYSGNVILKFGYDPTLLPPGMNEADLCLYQIEDGGWNRVGGVVDTGMHTLSATVTSLSVFALGVDALVTHTIAGSLSPSGSGTISGLGTYADGSSVSLSAAPNAGYVFTNWTEGGTEVSVSPGYTFMAQADRTLVANFVVVGSAKSVTTRSDPVEGGSTSGDGLYALGANATVVAIPNPGYKFSKWLENGATVSLARSNSFTVSSNHVVVAKFKPVYSIVVSPDPGIGGELEADPVYEAGELAKLKAKPNPGYSFVNWTQNGVSVSTATNYQFNVTANRDLVGHFALGHRIDVSAEPVNAGTVAGGGVYQDGSGIVAEASARQGYVFLNWTESGTVVSDLASYSFSSLSDRALVANFIAQPGLEEACPGGGVILVSWPFGANGWILQECTSLIQNQWTNSSRTVNVVSNHNQVTVSPLDESLFFRLHYP